MSEPAVRRGRPPGAVNRGKDQVLVALRACAKEIGRGDFDILKEVVEQYYEVKDMCSGMFKDVHLPTDPEAREEYIDALIMKQLGLRKQLFEYLKTLLEYCYPKKRAVEVSGDDENPIKVDMTAIGQKFDDLMRAGRPALEDAAQQAVLPRIERAVMEVAVEDD